MANSGRALRTMTGDSVRDYGRMAATALLVALLGLLALRYVPFLKVAENWVADLRIATLAPHQPQSERIVLLTITEDTLAGLPYRSPIDRGLLKRTVEELERRQVALIGLDILFDQASEPEKDRQLFGQLQASKVPVVLAWAEERDGLIEQQVAFLNASLSRLPHGLAVVEQNRLDGKVRSIILGRGQGEARVPGFSAALAAAAGAAVPAQATLGLRYTQGPDAETPAFKAYPLHLLAALPADWFRGRIVLIGVDLPTHDRHDTPLSLISGRTTPGVVIHAYALAQLLAGEPGYGIHPAAVLTIILAFSVAGVLIAHGVPALWLKGAAGLLLLALAWAGAFVLFRSEQVLLPIVVPTIAFVSSLGLEIGFKWRRELRQKRFVVDAFGKYLSPKMIDRLIADPAALRLSGEKKNMTFLFSDIAGFTSLVERTEPAALVSILNDYLQRATDVVMRHEGTIDKIVGDALHVMFNAPVDQPDHAARAVRCALDLDQTCEAFRRDMEKQGVSFGVTRIGVNTGDVVVGNYGGDQRFDYTAHGDAINAAARLEGTNKYLGTRICVSESTVMACPDMSFRPAARLVLRGQSAPTNVYEPLAATGSDGRPSEEYAGAFALLDKDAESALAAFESLSKTYPDDPLVRFHLERLVAGGSGRTVDLSQS